MKILFLIISLFFTSITYSQDSPPPEAWASMGSTIADGAIQMANGGNWNFDSTFGNFYLRNPLLSALPGFGYKMVTEPKYWKSHAVGLGSNIIGGMISKGIMNSNMRLGMKLELSSVTFPVMWNASTGMAPKF